jgi:CHAT domain-containing protein
LEKQQELMRPRMAAANLTQAFAEVKKLARSAQGRPFANPYWWAAFQCVGAGWPVERE